MGNAFIITIMAGMATMLGLFPIFLSFFYEEKIICGGLAFAAGVMICVSVVDLVYDSVLMLDKYTNGFFVCLFVFLFLFFGIFCSSLIERGVSYKYSSNILERVGIISLIAIVLHNIPEGIVTFISTTKSVSLGLRLALAIAFHNIPEGISIGVPIYYATGSKKRAFFYTFVAALSEPLGALIAYLFLAKFINDLVLGILFSFIAGIMIEISFNELLPNSLSYGYRRFSYFFFWLGVVFMLFKFLLN